MKEYDIWNSKKKHIEATQTQLYVHEREIWWCSLGLNIGSEIDGKHGNFERPVVIIKKYNQEMVVVLPITSTLKNDNFHTKIIIKNISYWVKLTQIRAVSRKRFLRKIARVSEIEFDSIKASIKI